MDLREPKKKRVGSHIKAEQPLPILIESESGIPFVNGLWPLYLGSFTGDCVVISNPEEISALYTMGFFGKGSFSRGYPSFSLTKKGIPPIIKERQWKRRKCWIEQMKKNISNLVISEMPDNIKDNTEEAIVKNIKTKQSKCFSNDITPMDIDSSDNSDVHRVCTVENNQDLNVVANKLCNSKITDVTDSLTSFKIEHPDVLDSTINDNKVLVLADSDDEDIEKVVRNPQPHLEEEYFKTVIETLNLSLEEAFFLSYALGCLQVIDMTGQSMSRELLWNTFREVKQDFIESYAAYHYFRAKGWVVKSGFKFGGDFLLYKQGPPFYHATYVVLVEKVDCHLQKHKNLLTWTKLHGLNRLAENSGKDIIICQVLFPDNITEKDLSSPKTLSKYQVNEVLIKRWISSQERIEKEQN